MFCYCLFFIYPSQQVLILALFLFVNRDYQVCQAHLALPVSLDFLAPRLQDLVVSGLLDHPDKMELQVNR